ncbi:MAG: hypothetical protein ABJA49_01810 [Betaproteobacteria bacterium]
MVLTSAFERFAERAGQYLVLATSNVSGTRQSELLGRTVQAIILVTALLVRADQIGIKATFLVIVAVATLLSGMLVVT